jgi:Raf kinase inhibitor-like YbhB/YbcL family protein
MLVRPCNVLAAWTLVTGAAAGGQMKLTSPQFENKAEIPAVHTCEGQDRSPALAWSEVPSGTKTLVLIVDDPDAPDPAAPRMTWVHWVLYQIPATARGLPEAVSTASLPVGAVHGANDFKRAAYGGPCPPIGRHRYFFKLYALDTALEGLGQADKAAVEKAMDGHILAKAELVGTYQKKKR